MIINWAYTRLVSATVAFSFGVESQRDDSQRTLVQTIQMIPSPLPPPPPFTRVSFAVLHLVLYWIGSFWISGLLAVPEKWSGHRAALASL